MAFSQNNSRRPNWLAFGKCPSVCVISFSAFFSSTSQNSPNFSLGLSRVPVTSSRESRQNPASRSTVSPKTAATTMKTMTKAETVNHQLPFMYAVCMYIYLSVMLLLWMRKHCPLPESTLACHPAPETLRTIQELLENGVIYSTSDFVERSMKDKIL